MSRERSCRQNSVQAVPAASRHIVALDIGTYACGFGLLKCESLGVHKCDNWPDQPSPYPKTRSALLYESGTPVEWGWTACKKYAQLSVADIASGRFWLVNDFKLALHDDAHAKAIKDKGLTPKQVMADYLQLFVQEVKRQLREAHGMTAADLASIQWCLTVPAMWTEASKQVMRQAVKRAGLVDDENSDDLSIILEPEAAAVHAVVNKAPPLIKGMTVCILDVGGGTADITVHDVKEVARRTVLAEAVAAHGALCGSVYVDEAFRKHYRTAVGQQAFDEWCKTYPDELQQLMDEWMAGKCDYKGPQDPAGPQSFRVMIPTRLLRLMSAENKQQLARDQGLSSASFVHEVVLDGHTMRWLFVGPVTNILNAAKYQLQQLSKPCCMVILVGGFASSCYLQQRVREVLTQQRLTSQVVVPPQPHAAILSGAALYCRSPSHIHARRCRLSYGVRCSEPFEKGAPPSSKFVHEENGLDYTNAYYDSFVFDSARRDCGTQL